MATEMAEVRHLSVSIHRSACEVYDFVSVPENFLKWATGLGKSLRKVGGEWIAETSQGPVKVRFTERNAFGVLDHWVIPQAGAEIHLPLRVVANGAGSELIFTLFRQPGMSDGQYARDVEWVMRDLIALQRLLET